MTYTTLLIIGYILLTISFLILYIFKPDIKNEYKLNVIECLVTYHREFTNSDKIALIAKLINEVDFEQLENWQLEGFINLINKKKYEIG